MVNIVSSEKKRIKKLQFKFSLTWIWTKKIHLLAQRVMCKIMFKYIEIDTKSPTYKK